MAISGSELFLRIIHLIVIVKCLINIDIKVRAFHWLTKVMAESSRLPAPGPGKWGQGPQYCVFLGSMSQPQIAKAKSIFLSLEHFFGSFFGEVA